MSHLQLINSRKFSCCDLIAVIGMLHSEESKAIYKKLENFTVQTLDSGKYGLLVKRESIDEKFNEHIELCISMDSVKTFEIFKMYLSKLKAIDEIENPNFFFIN